MMQLNTAPTRQEIEDQLAWMRSTKRFRNAPNQSDFLFLVVTRALQGKQTPGRVIADKLFPNKFVKLVSTDVRATASNLRSTLAKYYDQEGRGDLVVIRLPDPPEDRTVKLPEGHAYTPEILYNPNHAVAKQFGLGMFYLTKGSYEDCIRALCHFRDIWKSLPDHSEAYIGSAEAMCRIAEWEEWFNLNGERKKYWTSRAAAMLDRAQDRANAFWRWYAVSGFMSLLNQQPGEAACAFDRSLALNKLHTEAYPPYFKFLMTVGNAAEGLRLAKRHLEANFFDLTAHVSYAEMLIRAGQAAESVPVLENAMNMDAGNASVHCWLARIRVMQGRREDAMEHVLMVAKLSDELTLRQTVFDVMEASPPNFQEEWRKHFRNDGMFGFYEYALTTEKGIFPSFERAILSNASWA